MGIYRKEGDCCDSVTETSRCEPETCPFCSPVRLTKSSEKSQIEDKALTVEKPEESLRYRDAI
jgi:hypothetical protein